MSGKRKVIEGVSISSGIVLGTSFVVLPGDFHVTKTPVPVSRVTAETDALDQAIEATIEELRQMRASALRKAGGPVAKIFDAQLLIAGDYEFLKSVKNRIRSDKRNAAFVYNQAISEATAPLKQSSDHYLSQMAIDIEAVASKVLSHLCGSETKLRKLPPNTIVVSRVITPNDIIAYREMKAVGFVAGEGGTDSHMALIARSFTLPVVLARDDLKAIPNSCRLIVDGTSGEIIVSPTSEEWSEYQRRRKRQGPTLLKRIRKLKVFPPVTTDGREIGIAANLSLPGPADDLLAEQQIPVGLYRTEFLCLAHRKMPDEETQYQYYSAIAQKFAPAPVTLRVFDLGYDKLSPESNWPTEDNPALGWRGIRALLDMSTVFKTQIRAILRASTRRNLRIMLPMISDRSEIDRARRLISQVRLGLRRKGIDHDSDIKIGIMIEVPSAAMTAATLIKRADFVSLGTNDLTQYVLAADRGNRRVAGLYNPLHPAVLSMVRMVVDACHDDGVPVAVCGELAGEILAVPLLIGMGIDTLSMSPNRIVDVCRTIKTIDSTVMRHMTRSILAAESPNALMDRLYDLEAAQNNRQIKT
ncbi:MAG: phosphoenolpyruvate--protein phosphotransferase [candidate division Zixibacteria bacterium]|nr:phosphoenolpyruvate--protein phosphotransferase [candidate division Zixibacteria bacterium]